MIRRVKKRHYILIAVIMAALLVSENTLPLGINDYFRFYTLFFIKLTLWAALGLLILKLPSPLPSGLIRLNGTVVSLSLIFAVFHLLCFAVLGFFTSFAKNTYDLTPGGICLNLAAMGSVLFGGEMCRAFLINSPERKRPNAAIAFYSLVFALFFIPFANIEGLSGNMDVLNFVTYSVFPQLAQSFAASCLACLSGPLAAMAYLGVIRSFSYISPYIPNPSVIPGLLFNILFPLLSVSLILKIYAGEASESGKRGRNRENPFGWVAVSALSVAIVWFSVGVFPIFPSLILTGSMEPKIMPGDIVIVEKAGEAEVGDVVMYYSEDGFNITHRVIEKNIVSGDTQYITKGDNNPSADPSPVGSSQIKGRVIGTIPKIGKLSLMIRNSGNETSPF